MKRLVQMFVVMMCLLSIVSLSGATNTEVKQQIDVKSRSFGIGLPNLVAIEDVVKMEGAIALKQRVFIEKACGYDHNIPTDWELTNWQQPEAGLMPFVTNAKMVQFRVRIKVLPVGTPMFKDRKGRLQTVRETDVKLEWSQDGVHFFPINYNPMRPKEGYSICFPMHLANSEVQDVIIRATAKVGSEQRKLRVFIFRIGIGSEDIMGSAETDFPLFFKRDDSLNPYVPNFEDILMAKMEEARSFFGQHGYHVGYHTVDVFPPSGPNTAQLPPAGTPPPQAIPPAIPQPAPLPPVPPTFRMQMPDGSIRDLQPDANGVIKFDWPRQPEVTNKPQVDPRIAEAVERFKVHIVSGRKLFNVGSQVAVRYDPDTVRLVTVPINGTYPVIQYIMYFPGGEYRGTIDPNTNVNEAGQHFDVFPFQLGWKSITLSYTDQLTGKLVNGLILPTEKEGVQQK